MRYKIYGFFKILSYALCAALCALLLTACSAKTGTVETAALPLRDNTPVCLVPSADNSTVFSNEFVLIDASNASEGYIMVKYTGSCEKVKFQLIGPDYMTYTYNLTSEFDTFPLSAGSGSYSISIYENIQDKQYATVFSETHEFTITNEMGAFLYPNQYVNFQADSAVVNKAKELCMGTHDDLEVITNIYNYVTENITYDYEKAATVQSGYISDVDEILASQTGICLDYSAVMTAMLRSQRIPTRLEVGYAGDAYHAWISTYIPEQGWVNGVIQFNGTDWELMDPTFAANAGEKELKSFIGDGSKYTTKFIY